MPLLVVNAKLFVTLSHNVKVLMMTCAYILLWQVFTRKWNQQEERLVKLTEDEVCNFLMPRFTHVIIMVDYV